MRTGFISIACALLLSAPVFAATGEVPPPSITVVGNGKTYARPDMADINVGVVTEASTAEAALSSNNQAMSALLATLKQGGVEDKDVMTSNLNVGPEYRQPKLSSLGGDNAARPEIVGYRVDNQVHVKVRKLASLGPLLDRVVKSGGNNVNNINFMLADPAPVLDKARALAVEDAHRKAALYAQAAGVKLGRVLYISEGSNRPTPGPLRMMSAAPAAVPIAVGEEQLESTISVVYAIE